MGDYYAVRSIVRKGRLTTTPVINDQCVVVHLDAAAGGPACADAFIPWYSQCSGEFARMDLQAEILTGKKTGGGGGAMLLC